MHDGTNGLIVSRLIEKLLAAEALFGEAEVARRCGVKVRMWQLVKAGDTRFGARSLAAILRSFPGLRDEVVAYLAETPSGSPEPVEAVA